MQLQLQSEQLELVVALQANKSQELLAYIQVGKQSRDALKARATMLADQSVSSLTTVTTFCHLHHDRWQMFFPVQIT